MGSGGTSVGSGGASVGSGGASVGSAGASVGAAGSVGVGAQDANINETAITITISIEKFFFNMISFLLSLFIFFEAKLKYVC